MGMIFVGFLAPAGEFLFPLENFAAAPARQTPPPSSTPSPAVLMRWSVQLLCSAAGSQDTSGGQGGFFVSWHLSKPTAPRPASHVPASFCTCICVSPCMCLCSATPCTQKQTTEEQRWVTFVHRVCTHASKRDSELVMCAFLISRDRAKERWPERLQYLSAVMSSPAVYTTLLLLLLPLLSLFPSVTSYASPKMTDIRPAVAPFWCSGLDQSTRGPSMPRNPT